VHDEQGGILAIAKIGDLKTAGSRFTRVDMIPQKGQRLLEIELGAELDGRPLLELHKEYRVDISTSRLVRKS
jgi:hypothetical protein